MIEHFTEKDKALAFDFILKEYYKSGFASLNKSDIDLLFFSTLLKFGNIENKSDYELSKLLQITQSRIRNLKVKNALKYAPLHFNEIENVFLEKAKFARLESDLKRISIPIYDPNIYIELENLIEKENGFVEAQLNPKIFTIRIDQFFSLLLVFQSIHEKRSLKEIKKEYLAQLQVLQKEVSEYHKELKKEPILSFKDLQKKLLDKGFEYSFKLIADLIPGGTYIKKLTDVVLNSIRS
jgi:hypothetical protein